MKTTTRDRLWGFFFIFGAVPISLIMPSVGIIGGIALVVISNILRSRASMATQQDFLRYATIAGVVAMITGITIIVLGFNISNISIPS
ncbi:MAG: hypothetical protein GFH27_549311n137 [Chloroflexi bacterium AL-W]|nr:hypothetical protein [Chloroflexi bacterium AL-N1]NOK68685.1 hypothetical protein [Chloroflexi bacterium AL-N10]NOK76171.1 hypothetical protein [Chloroflexi bacterium AL-N5]NOK84192.1 hypothetical protein [Chloroflexi bacterium AL-W]NOK91309.1 hypothetical protein [Chloroflexi bacterium AL-N15]